MLLANRLQEESKAQAKLDAFYGVAFAFPGKAAGFGQPPFPLVAQAWRSLPVCRRRHPAGWPNGGQDVRPTHRLQACATFRLAGVADPCYAKRWQISTESQSSPATASAPK